MGEAYFVESGVARKPLQAFSRDSHWDQAVSPSRLEPAPMVEWGIPRPSQDWEGSRSPSPISREVEWG